MAIYSLHHRPIGKSTQAAPYTAAAHVRYITRPSAMSRLEAARMPETPGRAATFMRRGEDQDRKNGRVADKLMLALPKELDPVQRADLVRQFAEEVTQGRAPWLAAFHDRGKDLHNPHCHLLIRDRDIESGKRVADLSEKGSTERLRELWETHANRALEAAGRAERIDRRTLEAQGIHREPTIHEGPQSQEMDKRGATPTSRVRRVRNGPGAKTPERTIDYRSIDGALSRPTYNREIKDRETPADYWAAIEQHKRREELEHLRSIHLPPVNGERPAVPERMMAWKGQDGALPKERAVNEVDNSDRKRRAAFLSQQKTREAESGSLFRNAMEQAYRDPDAAYDKMQDFRAAHGDPALMQALADPNTQAFGKRPGSLLSRDGYTEGAGKRRRDAQIARRSLPELYAEAERDKVLKAGAERAHDQLNPTRPDPGDYRVPEPYNVDRTRDHSVAPGGPRHGRNPEHEPVPYEPRISSRTPERPGEPLRGIDQGRVQEPAPMAPSSISSEPRQMASSSPRDENAGKRLQEQRLASVQPRPLPRGYEASILPHQPRTPASEPADRIPETANRERTGPGTVDDRRSKEKPMSSTRSPDRSAEDDRVRQIVQEQRRARDENRAPVRSAERSESPDKVAARPSPKQRSIEANRAADVHLMPPANVSGARTVQDRGRSSESLPGSGSPGRLNDGDKMRQIIAQQRAKSTREKERDRTRERGLGD